MPAGGREVSVAVVGDTPAHPQCGTCPGLFVARTGCIELAESTRRPALLSDRDARHSLPPDIVFRGLVAHELAHALVAQNADETRIARADHEFIAAVFEMDAYGEAARATLLAADPVRPEGSRDLVNSGIYALAQRVFANNAWQLFRAADDGCAMIGDILAGQVSLPFRSAIGAVMGGRMAGTEPPRCRAG